MADTTIDRQDLLDEINDFSDKLGSASRWKTSGDAFGHLTQRLDGKVLSESIAKSDYFYEFYCYLRILVDLQKNYEVVFVKGDKMFPRGPASKNGKPFFKILEDGKEIGHVCSGTKILTFLGTERAPDISFQFPDADPVNPKYDQVYFVMDAKYHASNKTKGLTRSEFDSFSTVIEHLQLRKKIKFHLKFNQLKEFSDNLLITNSNSYPLFKTELEHSNIKVVEYFDLALKHSFYSGKLAKS